MKEVTGVGLPKVTLKCLLSSRVSKESIDTNCDEISPECCTSNEVTALARAVI